MFLPLQTAETSARVSPEARAVLDGGRNDETGATVLAPRVMNLAADALKTVRRIVAFSEFDNPRQMLNVAL